MSMPVPFRLALLLLLFSMLLTACTTAQASTMHLTATAMTAPAAPPLLARAASTPVGRFVITPTAVDPSLPTPTAGPPTSTPDPLASPTPWPTPTARPAGTPPRVGLQVGHLRSNELPDELERLRTSTGARWGNVSEAELNLEIVNRVKPLLEAQGVMVDVIPATVPPAYSADAFLAIHADGAAGSGPRGWKLATPWRASEASKQLLAAVAAAYGPATGMPEDVGGVTINMKGYYAFSWRRYTHAIDRYTPAIIVEMGFMTNAADRAILFGQPDRVARGIADGILAYLAQNDPANGAARVPPDYPLMRAVSEGVAVRAAPREDGRLLARIGPEQRVTPFDKQDGWFQAFVRIDDSRVIGWIRADQLNATNEQPVFPTPTNP